MSRIIDIIRRVVQQELTRRRGSQLGVVTAVYPHTARDDRNNYAVNVRLKHEDLELRHVPVAVSHVGMAAPARVGDLVLVEFVNGDLNQPLVIGRFYHADERPPLHQEGEVLFEQRVPDGTLNHLRFTADGTIYLQRGVTKPEDNSAAQASITISGQSGDIVIRAGDRVAITLKNDDSGAIELQCSNLIVTGDMAINGALRISDGTNSTTISGNEIQGT